MNGTTCADICCCLRMCLTQYNGGKSYIMALSTSHVCVWSLSPDIGSVRRQGTGRHEHCKLPALDTCLKTLTQHSLTCTEVEPCRRPGQTAGLQPVPRPSVQEASTSFSLGQVRLRREKHPRLSTHGAYDGIIQQVVTPLFPLSLDEHDSIHVAVTDRTAISARIAATFVNTLIVTTYIVQRYNSRRDRACSPPTGHCIQFA